MAVMRGAGPEAGGCKNGERLHLADSAGEVQRGHRNPAPTAILFKTARAPGW